MKHPSPFLFRSNRNVSAKPFKLRSGERIMKFSFYNSNDITFHNKLVRLFKFVRKQVNIYIVYDSNDIMFHNKLVRLFKFVRKRVNIYIVYDSLICFLLNLRFLISDKGSRDASFIDLSDSHLIIFISQTFRTWFFFCSFSQNKQTPPKKLIKSIIRFFTIFVLKNSHPFRKIPSVRRSIFDHTLPIPYKANDSTAVLTHCSLWSCSQHLK